MGSKKNRNIEKRVLRACKSGEWGRLTFDEAQLALATLFATSDDDGLLDLLDSRQDGTRLAGREVPISTWSAGESMGMTIAPGVTVNSAAVWTMCAATAQPRLLLSVLDRAGMSWGTVLRSPDQNGVSRHALLGEYVVFTASENLRAVRASLVMSDEDRIALELFEKGTLDILSAVAAGTGKIDREWWSQDEAMFPSGGNVVEAACLAPVPEAREIFLTDRAKRQGAEIAAVVDGTLAAKEDEAAPPVKVKSWKDRVA